MERTSRVNQGADRVNKTGPDLTGASELRMLVIRVALENQSSGEEEESGVRVVMHGMRESMLMSLILQ